MCRQQGHAFSIFTLDVSLPGATLVRQQAVWHWLRREAAGRELFAGHSPACDVVDLKEAVRLMLVEPLAKQLKSTPSTGKLLLRWLYLGTSTAICGC